MKAHIASRRGAEDRADTAGTEDPPGGTGRPEAVEGGLASGAGLADICALSG
jgi:hypothetical protein